MALSVDSSSRFSKTTTTILGSEEVWGRWKPPRFLSEPLPNESVQLFQVTNEYAGRPDKIASLFYGSSQLDWVIIAFNNHFKVFNWPLAGSIIKIPDPSLVLTELT